MTIEFLPPSLGLILPNLSPEARRRRNGWAIFSREGDPAEITIDGNLEKVYEIALAHNRDYPERVVTILEGDMPPDFKTRSRERDGSIRIGHLTQLPDSVILDEE